MPSRLLRSLVLASSFVLALPPAWCCFLAPRGPGASHAGERKAALPPCCVHGDGGPRPSSDSKPVPSKSNKCPCDDRYTVNPDPSGKQTVGHDLTPPTPADAGAGRHSSLGGVRLLISRDLTPLPPLHLLNCVWLC
jgi:hypothetical protein